MVNDILTGQGGASDPQIPPYHLIGSLFDAPPSLHLLPASTPPPLTDPAAAAGPPTPNPLIGQYLDTAQQLHAKAATMAPPNYPGMSVAQALVGIGGALATSNNPHAQFVAGYMPALGQEIERQYGSNEQAWQVARQNLLDQANLLRQRAGGLQQWQQDMYKAQMGVYGQQLRGIGAAEVRANADGTTPSNAPASTTIPAPTPDPSAARVGLLRERGIPDDVAAKYLPGVSRMPDADAAAWAGNQASADRLISQAGQVVAPPGQKFDPAAALYTVSSIGSSAQAIRNQIPALRAARMGLVAQRGAVEPASDAARNLQAGIDQYDQAIQASGAQLDRLAGASRQVSAELAKRAAANAAMPNLPTAPAGSIGGGANAVNQANAGFNPATFHPANADQAFELSQAEEAIKKYGMDPTKVWSEFQRRIASGSQGH